MGCRKPGSVPVVSTVLHDDNVALLKDAINTLHTYRYSGYEQGITGNLVVTPQSKIVGPHAVQRTQTWLKLRQGSSWSNHHGLEAMEKPPEVGGIPGRFPSLTANDVQHVARVMIRLLYYLGPCGEFGTGASTPTRLCAHGAYSRLPTKSLSAIEQRQKKIVPVSRKVEVGIYRPTPGQLTTGPASSQKAGSARFTMPAIKNFLNRYFNKEQRKCRGKTCLPIPPPSEFRSVTLTEHGSQTTATNQHRERSRASREYPSPFPLPNPASHLLSNRGVIYTLFYVVPFYLSATTRPSRTLSRDAPSVIRARVTSVSLTCVVCSLITFVILTSQGRATNGEALHSMGYWPLGLAETSRSLLLTAILFSGPLYETLIVNGEWRRWFSLQPVSGLFSEWIRWRNIVAGPFTEEVLFRSASVPLMLIAQTSVARTIFLSPVIFGLAHFHHFYEFRVTHPHEPVVMGLLRSLLQFS
ncbi:hypothetical protein CIB48_g7042 [Xylaria polymorpha]|nr:hypothetical protein CIB48_g7042 [Xylaria polymorpha]